MFRAFSAAMRHLACCEAVSSFPAPAASSVLFRQDARDIGKPRTLNETETDISMRPISRRRILGGTAGMGLAALLRRRAAGEAAQAAELDAMRKRHQEYLERLGPLAGARERKATNGRGA